MKGPHRKLRVLLLYMAAATGHRQAAEAIRQALKEFYPEVEIRSENLFRHGNSLVRRLLKDLYNTVIKVTPWFWNFIWDSKEIYWLTYALTNLLYRLNYLRLYKKVFLPFKPQVVICTHSVACALSSVIKRVKKENYLLAAVPTDFCIHPYWFYENVDIYFLPHKELKEKLIGEGIDPKKIRITGIPTSLNFSKSHNSKELKKKWELKEGLFTILLMGGGQGVGSLREIVFSLDSSNLPLQLLVVTGANRRLRKELEGIRTKISLPLRLFGYTRQVDELMEVSDLLISKPGGLTTAEALVKELPLGIVDSLAGQERRNKQLLLRKEIAFELNSREAIIRLINNLKDNSFDLESWRKRARKLACPRAAEKIAQTVMESSDKNRHQ
ncbi:hypothetical protein CEE34_02540 [Candidatus Aerophobetes bacterium Ae_b3a]|nr:MAG: hypothetical protein CEE34_02540 [Candidatus Aerophobetes bacterium Ae_b3a]